MKYSKVKIEYSTRIYLRNFFSKFVHRCRIYDFEYSNSHILLLIFHFFKTILRIFDGFEYSKIFLLFDKKNSSNIRRHRIFEEWSWNKSEMEAFTAIEYSIFNIRKSYIRSYSTNFLRISKIEYFSKNPSNTSYRCCELLSKIKFSLLIYQVWAAR